MLEKDRFLAVTICLAVFSLLLSSAAVILARKVSKLSMAHANCTQFHHDVIEELRAKVDTIPKTQSYALGMGIADQGILIDPTQDTYTKLKLQVEQFVLKWVKAPAEDESEQRIENILFKDNQTPGTEDSYCAMFSNPHEYTASEICSLLTSTTPHQRANIFVHVILAIILPGVMLNLKRDPRKSLLPFRDVRSLSKLFEIIRGEDLGPNIRLYLGKYQLYESLDRSCTYLSFGPGSPWARINRDLYIDLIEALISPFLIILEAQEADMTSRQMALHRILDTAVLFGLQALGQTRGETAVLWGSRRGQFIMKAPALWLLVFRSDKTMKLESDSAFLGHGSSAEVMKADTDEPKEMSETQMQLMTSHLKGINWETLTGQPPPPVEEYRLRL